MLQNILRSKYIELTLTTIENVHNLNLFFFNYRVCNLVQENRSIYNEWKYGIMYVIYGQVTIIFVQHHS